ncbi:glutamate racemase [Fontimonas thermophila]|uniref:Glutamate racemase n=1 Tax=Fontimonas thermophila TaxID=1076937 RepID=A0A1I2ISD1_9GAMM|nr:glutamate racemase [Fontimonas thermophila]SFF45164.1 glutamate racemase [Fontimonas thermophila]
MSIGIFDSGVGGISVLREIRRLLPAEDLIYYADSAHCPYGGKPREQILARSTAITEFLIAQGARLIVVACNTATIAAVEHLRATYPLSFVGMEPAVKPAVALTRTGVVGVLATGAALAGEKFHRLLAQHAGGVRVITQPCPGLVEQVEYGDLDGPQTRALVERYTRPLLAQRADVLVLGCTHYPFLRPLIQDVVGPAVTLLDTGEAVARQTQRLLERQGVLVGAQRLGTIAWHTSGDAAAFARLRRLLLPEDDGCGG